MRSILLLSRGKRLSAIFAELARELSTDFQVHVALLGSDRLAPFNEEAKLFQNIPNVVVYNLDEEFKNAWKSRMKSEFPIKESINQVETKLGMTVYQAGSNYLLYRRFSYEYYKDWHGLYDDENELCQEFLGAYDFFSALYDRVKPSGVFCEMPDLASHRVAMALALERGIFEFHIALVGALGMKGFFLASGSRCRNALAEFYFKNPKFLTAENLAKAQALSNSYAQTKLPENAYVSTLRKQSGKFLSRLSSSRLKSVSSKELPAIVLRESSRFTNNRWLESKFNRELPKNPYILFMLHHQPEANTNLMAPRWIEQNRIVEQLAINAPFGMKIVVKENPKTFGLRGKDYFGPIERFQNVHLLHPSVDTAESLAKAEAILAISGTVGLEAIFMNKRVGVLAPIYYSFFPGVRNLKYPEEIFQHLKDPSWNPGANVEELNHFRAAFLQTCYEFGKPEKGSPWPEAKEGGKGLALGIRDFLSNTEKYHLHPKDFPLGI